MFIGSVGGEMCNKNSSPPSDSQPKHPMPSIKEPTDSLITLTRRRIPRKRKFRSLSLQLSAKPSDQRKNKSRSKRMKHDDEQQKQLNLFPLHPENLVEDKDDNMQEENDVALLFSSDSGATLNGLLESGYSTTTTATATTRTTTTSEEDSFSPPSMTCPVSDGGDNGSWLVRKAMRRREKERDESEERWVCYSEVTSYCNSAASGGGAAASAMDREPLSWFDEERGKGGANTTAFGVLSLKLDYEGILNAWSDKGSLYVPPKTPQTVPDLHKNAANDLWDGCWGNGAAGNLWKVPENDGANSMKIKVKEEMGDKLGQREASVLRYKEKRRNRLFSKRIRYEVRKLNAEKRPRMKGRFVKRD